MDHNGTTLQVDAPGQYTKADPGDRDDSKDGR